MAFLRQGNAPDRRISLALACFLLGACGSEEDDGVVVEMDMAYERLVDGFVDEEDCRQTTTGSGFNCYNTLVLCENGGFEIILTDIVNEGRCVPTGEMLRCTIEGPGDLGEGTVLTVRPSSSTIEISEIAGDHPWVEIVPTPDRVSESCENLTGRTWW